MADDTQASALIDFIRREVSKDPRVPMGLDTPLVSAGLVDSMSLISVLAFVEDAFAVVIPDEAATAEAMDTPRAILALVRAFKPGNS